MWESLSCPAHSNRQHAFSVFQLFFLINISFPFPFHYSDFSLITSSFQPAVLCAIQLYCGPTQAFTQYIKLTKPLKCASKSLCFFPNMSKCMCCFFFSFFLNVSFHFCVNQQQQQSQWISFQIKCKALQWQLHSLLCFFYCALIVHSGFLSCLSNFDDHFFSLVEFLLSLTLAGMKTDFSFFCFVCLFFGFSLID